MKDYYGILGVLPTAEDIVIRAAYKALAQCYHPDRYEGAKDEASKRMSEINEAYSVLSNFTQRQQYDDLRGKGTQDGDSFFDESSASKTSFNPLEQDWNVALKYYPDLSQLEGRLTQISWGLAFAFKAHLLEAKVFDERQSLVDRMEQQFLELYFGNNPRIINFARRLIGTGERSAAKALNMAVRVLGGSADSTKIIKQIIEDHHLSCIVDASLETAVWDRNWAMASKLLREGVKPDGVCRDGLSLLDLARMKEDQNMILLLKAHGAT